MISATLIVRWRGLRQRIAVAWRVLWGIPLEITVPLRESETQSLVDAALRAAEQTEEMVN
jgi:hypothetical protein